MQCNAMQCNVCNILYIYALNKLVQTINGSDDFSRCIFGGRASLDAPVLEAGDGLGQPLPVAHLEVYIGACEDL